MESSKLDEVVSSFKDLFKSEIRLAKTEVQNSLGEVTSAGIKIGMFAIIVLLGVFPFMAFLIVGIGKLLGDSYGLSSLIVAVLMIGGGAFFALRTYRKLRVDMTLPQTRTVFQSDLENVSNFVHKNVISIEEAYKTNKIDRRAL